MPRECRAILEDVDESKKSRAAKIVQKVNLAPVTPQSESKHYQNIKSQSPSPERRRQQSTDNLSMIQDQQIKQLAQMIIPMAQIKNDIKVKS